MLYNLLACTTCSVNSQGDNNAASWAILFLLGVVVPLITSLAFFLVRMARRSNSQLAPEFIDEFEVNLAKH